MYMYIQQTLYQIIICFVTHFGYALHLSQTLVEIPKFNYANKEHI